MLTADRATVNEQTGETEADGRVRIQRDDQIWAGEHIRYNFKTRQMETAQFRTGKTPVFAAGEELRPIVETAWAWHKKHPDGYGT